MERSFLLTQGALSVPCKLSAPESARVRRVVLGVHGFGGSTQDPIQEAIAEEMLLFQSAAVRFDFPAHGESTTDALTLHGCTESLLAVARYAREAYPQVEDLCIFATGFGAYVTLACLPKLLELPGKVKLVVQTPSVLMHETLLAMTRRSAQTLRAMERVTLPAPRPFDVTYDFYEELRNTIVMTGYPIPILILHGEADDYISMADIQNFHRINEQSKLVIIPGASHRFLEEGAWDMVLDLTRDWFSFEQVLLTDWH